MYLPKRRFHLIHYSMVTEEDELRINSAPSIILNLYSVHNTRDGSHGDIFGENLSAVKSQSWVSFKAIDF